MKGSELWVLVNSLRGVVIVLLRPVVEETPTPLAASPRLLIQLRSIP